MFLTLLASLASAPDPAILRVGTYAYPKFDRAAALAPLADLVASETGRRVEVILLPSPEHLSQAICDGRVDVAMTNLGAFVQVRACPDIKAVAVLDTPPAILARYRGILIARRDVRLKGLTGLKKRAGGLRYSEVLPGSTSGALVQADALRRLAIDRSSFRETRQAGTHEGALEELLSGRADVAAMAEEPWKTLQATSPDRAAKLRMLWRSGPLPVGPIVCREGPALRCDALALALLGSAGAGVAAKLSGGWTEAEGAVRFRGYNNVEYAPFQPVDTR